jgi:hypothetical protein
MPVGGCVLGLGVFGGCAFGGAAAGGEASDPAVPAAQTPAPPSDATDRPPAATNPAEAAADPSPKPPPAEAPAAATARVVPDRETLRLPATPAVALPADRPPLTRRPEDLRRRAELLLKAHRVAVPGPVPSEHLLPLDRPVDLRPGSAVEAWRAWRTAWLQDDPDAGYALLAPEARAATQSLLERWRGQAEREGLDAFCRRLAAGSGRPGHAEAIRRLGDVGLYGVRKFFDTAWTEGHRDPRRLREIVHSWELSAAPDGPTAAWVRRRVIGSVLGEPREETVRAAVDPADGSWRVVPEID